jgi:hypothetical protein
MSPHLRLSSPIQVPRRKKIELLRNDRCRVRLPPGRHLGRKVLTYEAQVDLGSDRCTRTRTLCTCVCAIRNVARKFKPWCFGVRCSRNDEASTCGQSGHVGSGPESQSRDRPRSESCSRRQPARSTENDRRGRRQSDQQPLRHEPVTYQVAGYATAAPCIRERPLPHFEKDDACVNRSARRVSFFDHARLLRLPRRDTKHRPWRSWRRATPTRSSRPPRRSGWRTRSGRVPGTG